MTPAPSGAGTRSEGASEVWRASVWALCSVPAPTSYLLSASCPTFVLEEPKAEILAGISHLLLMVL